MQGVPGVPGVPLGVPGVLLGVPGVPLGVPGVLLGAHLRASEFPAANCVLDSASSSKWPAFVTTISSSRLTDSATTGSHQLRVWLDSAPVASALSEAPIKASLP